MTIDLHVAEKGGRQTLTHDLNFAKPRYESKHVVSFRNPNSNLLALLAKSGPIPGDDANGVRKKQSGGGEKRKRTAQVDMDKLADGLVRLQEDDLLQVVQMIHDNKSEDTYTKNDIERKSFRPLLSSSCSRMEEEFSG
jgi:transcription initiation factor IIF auxiliary subunit